MAIAIITTHLFLKGLEALALRTMRPRYEIGNRNEYGGYPNHKNTHTKRYVIRPYNVSRYDLYEIIRSRMNKTATNQVRNQYPSYKPNANEEEYDCYINRGLPRTIPRPFPFPIKHIVTIVNWLRRAVNQSGKEPFQLTE
jgi:hypothetical protein